MHADVAITGVEGALLDNVLAFLDLDTEPCDAERSLVERKHRGAPDAIRTALQALGYYEPQITPSLELGADCWHATFAIAAGEPVRLRTIDLRVTGDGSTDTAFATAQTAAALRAGEPLDHGAYERLKRTLGDLAAERGYAEAQFEEHRIDVYPGEHVADVALRFDTGPRYRFGAVSFRQQVLSEQLLGSFKQFSAGDWYDGRALADLQSALTNSGYFQVVQVAPQSPDRERRAIPVEIVLTPAPRKITTYGLGFATDTGLALRFDRDNRRWNDRGHQFGFYAHLSPVLSEVMANYRMPLDEPREEWINFDAGIKSEDTETASSDTFVLGARRLSRGRMGWFRTDSLSLQLEDFELAEQRGRSRLFMPAVSWSRIRADNRIRVERGSKLQLEVRGAGDDLGSEATFLQTIATAEWIRPLIARGRMLLRGQVGTTALEELEELPASVRFFAGGDNSVRGYGFKELGPVDDEGELIGGSSLFAASFEYEHSSANAGASHSSSTAATRSTGRISRSRPALGSADAGNRRSGRCAWTSRTRSTIRRTIGACTSLSARTCKPWAYGSFGEWAWHRPCPIILRISVAGDPHAKIEAHRMGAALRRPWRRIAPLDDDMRRRLTRA